MENWIELESEQYQFVWDKFDKIFKFNPYGFKDKLPTFELPSPYQVFDISHLYGSDFENNYKNLEDCIVKAFLDCINEREYLYALDWQHSSYLFNPSLKTILNEWGEWPITLYPNGDYYFFINETMSWGYLGHPWEKSISIFGEEFIKAVEKNRPNIFNKEIRRG